jgi:solute carrier family 35 protein C2
LTEVNIIGVMIAIIGKLPLPGHRIETTRPLTFTGIALYTYHKYQKSITTPIPLEPTDHRYTAVNDTTTSGVPLEHLDSPNPNPNPTYPPITRERETEEDRTQRLRDEFEGWGRESSSWSGDDADPDEVDEDEVERRMAEREGGKGVGKGGKWGEWWAKEM